MTVKQTVILFAMTLAVLFLVDMIWLGVVAKGLYRRHLGAFMSPKVVWPAAVLFYLVFIAGLLVFAVRPALVGGGPPQALLFGGFLGLVAYATYDLTNLATFKDWPLVVTVVDLIWGTCLGAVVSWLSTVAARGLFKP